MFPSRTGQHQSLGLDQWSSPDRANQHIDSITGQLSQMRDKLVSLLLGVWIVNQAVVILVAAQVFQQLAIRLSECDRGCRQHGEFVQRQADDPQHGRTVSLQQPKYQQNQASQEKQGEHRDDRS